mgnify:CR=1 FL=1
MFQLIPYLKGYKKESVIGPLFKLLEACFELIVPLVMAKIIDVGIENRDMLYILKMGGVLILLGVIGLCMFADGAVLCGKGSSWVWDGAAP